MDAALCLLDVDYFLEQNRPVIRLWCVNTAGKRVVLHERGYAPYFYIEPKEGADMGALEERTKRVEVEGSGPERLEWVTKRVLGKERKLLKVFVTIPVDVVKFRNAVRDWKDVRKEYEYALPFHRRYIIERRLTPMGWFDAETVQGELVAVTPLEKDAYPPLRVMAFDIEVVMEKDGEKVIMVSLAGNSGFRKVISYGKHGTVRGTEIVRGEKELIERFVEIVGEQDPDIIAGYNSDRFDMLKLDERAREYGIALKLGKDSTLRFERRGRISAAHLAGRVHVDLYDFTENILAPQLATEVLSLDRVSRELVGKGKHTLNWKEIEKAWRKRDVKRIASYCMKDSVLTLELADYMLPQIFELCRVTGQLLFDTGRMSYSQLVEWLYMRKAHEAGAIIPNRPTYDEIQRRRQVSYLGGYVHTPTEGIHENIALFDFASLYPSIAITHNISPETLDCPCCSGGRNSVRELHHHFCTQTTGFISRVLEDLVTRRIELKERMKHISATSMRYRRLNNRQHALKILANASYGYYAYPGSRWYSKVCAEAITSMGRMYIKNAISLAESLGFFVIYGDTDSLFLKMRQKEVAGFLKRVNSVLPGIMELEFKGFYPSGLFVLGKGGVAAKKRYALLDKKGNMVIRGLERVRRDWSAIAKNTQERVLMAVLKDRNPDKAVRIVRSIIRKLKSGKAGSEDLVIYTQLTKPIREYEQIGPHVAVAKKILERGGHVRAGATISYIITRGTGTISERAEPADNAGEYDPDYYINNQVLPAAMRVLAGLGYREEDFFRKRNDEQFSLEKYMKRR